MEQTFIMIKPDGVQRGLVCVHSLSPLFSLFVKMLTFFRADLTRSQPLISVIIRPHIGSHVV